MSLKSFLKTTRAVNRMLPHRLYISITDRCGANCDFCSFRDMKEPSYNKTSYLALTMGSIHELGYKDVIQANWQANEFLKALSEGTIHGIYRDILKKSGQKVHDENFFSCHDCYKLRSGKNFSEFFNVRDDYKTTDLTLREWQLIIEDAYHMGVRELVFADEGEPVMEIDKLCHLLNFSNKKFKNLTVFTNGYFAHDVDSALAVLERLKKSGLTSLGISCDFHSKYKFHQSFIPLANIANVVKAARELKIDTFFSSLFLDYNDAVNLKNNLENMIGKKLALCNSDWDEIQRAKDIIKYFLTILTKKGSVFKRDAFFASKVMLNPRVEAFILEKDLSPAKPRQSDNFRWLKKCAYRYIRPCFKNQVILSNGLVVCCAMNAY